MKVLRAVQNFAEFETIFSLASELWYLTITLWARDFYRVKADEGAARISYHA